MFKKLAIVFAAIVTSLFYFPFEFTFLPGYNTKMILAAIGIVVCIWKMVRSHDSNVPISLLFVILMAGMVSLASLFAIAYNHTRDTAYVSYIVSMSVWLSAAFVVCSLVKSIHGGLSFVLLSRYLIAVCVAQCVLALVIDSSPSFAAIVDRFVSQGQAMLKDLNRLYGIGASLDVAGTRFSVVLILLCSALHIEKDRIHQSGVLLYLIAFLVIAVVGSMIARTTYVGVVLGVVLVVFNHDKLDFKEVKISSLRVALLFVLVLGVLGSISVFAYNHSEQFHSLFRFAFEGFFNYFESGDYTIASGEKLKTMYVWPDNVKTWIVGDGYFSNPRGDIYYVGDSTTQGFYMGTDVGYCRFIFYFGLIGLIVFSLFFIVTAIIIAKRLPKFKLTVFFVLVSNFVIWFKVATDVFPAFALLLCLAYLADSDDYVEDPEEIAAII